MTDDDRVNAPKLRLVDNDRVRIEFLIDDLIRQIGVDGLSPIASCNGCHNCSASVEISKEVTR